MSSNVSTGNDSGFGPSVFETDLNLPRRRGKVRDVYELPAAGNSGDRLLLVASDRISAFDVVMPTPVPGKGRLLTQIAAWWLRWIEDQGICSTHLISTDAAEIPENAFEGATTTRRDLEGRVTIGRRLPVVPVECVVRGYLEGSGLRDYQRTGSVCGVALPAGLRQCDKLPEPIFTPATKAEEGPDENIGFDAAAGVVGLKLMTRLRDLSMEIYSRASEHARTRGIIIADTKFEFGVDPGTGEPVLIDEALTPDSSRFWPAHSYEPGHAQPSFDKQFVREHLEGVVNAGQWDKTPPGPELPSRVIEGTLERYSEVCERLRSG